MKRILFSLTFAALFACSGSGTSTDGLTDGVSSSQFATTLGDGGITVVPTDAGVPTPTEGDAGLAPPDAGAPPTTIVDAGVAPHDAGTPAPVDAGVPWDGPTLAGCKLFPKDNVWNTDISAYPLSSHSDDYIANIGRGTGLHADFGAAYWAGAPNGMPVTLVTSQQAMVPLSFTYAAQSDSGPYPIPLDAPIQGGPDSAGDRHVVVLETSSCTLYEIYKAYPGSSSWSAGSGAIWHLDRNEQRPDGWTSADAAGLAILPGLLRYDEVAAGEVKHALRMTVSAAQHAFIHPAVHSDGTAGNDATHIPMGARVRLKASFDISAFSPHQQVILRGLKKYGFIVADTGADWFFGGMPDSRWDDSMLHGLSAVTGADFEVVDSGPVHTY